MANPGRTQDRGSRKENLPAGVNLPAGGSEGSDDSLQGESRESGVTPTSLPPSDFHGGLGGASVKEEQQASKGVVWVRYAEKGSKPVIAKCHAEDPFDVCEWIEKRMGLA